MNEEFLSRISNPEQLKKDFSFVSLFVMSFEEFISNWKKELLCFESGSFEIDEETEEVTPIYVKLNPYTGQLEEDKNFEEICKDKILKCYKNKRHKVIETLSICKYLKQFGAITDEDFNLLVNIFNRRNQFVHELFNQLEKGISQKDITLFKELMRIRTKVSDYWYREVEMLTNCNEEYLDENGKFIEPDTVFNDNDLLIMHLANQILEESNQDRQYEKAEHADC